MEGETCCSWPLIASRNSPTDENQIAGLFRSIKKTAKFKLEFLPPWPAVGILGAYFNRGCSVLPQQCRWCPSRENQLLQPFLLIIPHQRNEYGHVGGDFPPLGMAGACGAAVRCKGEGPMVASNVALPR